MRIPAPAGILAAAALSLAACADDAPAPAGAPATTPATSASTQTAASTTSSPAGLALARDDLDAATSQALASAGQEAFALTSAPGAILAVRTADGDWVASLGQQRRGEAGSADPMTPELHQRVGSITKTFVVTALLQQAEQGTLSLDDPIEDYVAGLPNGEATLRHLAQMRSGIPSYTTDDAFVDALLADPTQSFDPDALVDVVRGAEPMFEPGTQMYYSNTNTVLLGMVLEQVTGRPLAQVLDEGIFTPLGLGETVLPEGTAYPEPHPRGDTLQGADDDTPRDATDWDPSWAWAAGALVSTVDDLLDYGEALGTGEGLLAPRTQAERLESFDYDVPAWTTPTSSVPQTPERAYGTGLGQSGEWVGHDGLLPGYNSYLQHHVPTGTTLVVLTNTDIVSGADCGESPTLPDNPGEGPCDSAANRIGAALADALGAPLR